MAPTLYPPGYGEEEYYGDGAFVVAILYMVLEIVIVASRFAVRLSYKSPCGVDDYLTIPALLFCVGMCTLLISMFEPS